MHFIVETNVCSFCAKLSLILYINFPNGNFLIIFTVINRFPNVGL